MGETGSKRLAFLAPSGDHAAAHHTGPGVPESHAAQGHIGGPQAGPNRALTGAAVRTASHAS
jgi:hypothetical protein